MFFNRRKKLNNFLNLYLVIVALLVCFLLGFFVGREQGESNTLVEEVSLTTPLENSGEVLNKDDQQPDFLTEDVEFETFWDVWKLLSRKYVDLPLSETSLFYGAVKGMVDSLGDPYTVFLDPEMYGEFAQDLEGSFEGIGAEIGIKHGQLVIIAPLPGSPAEKAGVLPGDFVLEIDGKITTGITLDSAVRNIRGEGGTPVVLTMYRNGFEEPQEFSITRGTINVQSVTYEFLDNNIAYIEIAQFNDDTLELFNDAVNAIRERQPEGIIVDLRNNPGGYLHAAVAVASEWIEDDIVVIEKFSDGRARRYPSTGRPDLEGFETVVLVNEGSASASEIVAGALQDYGEAELVGKKTFGKGSVQTLEELPDGSALKITVAKWLTPKERNINEEGVDPDFVISLTEEDFSNDVDPQLEKAVELIQD